MVNSHFLRSLAGNITKSYRNSPVVTNLHCQNLPSKDETQRILSLLRKIIFPIKCTSYIHDRKMTYRCLSMLQKVLLRAIPKCLLFRDLHVNKPCAKNRQYMQEGNDIIENILKSLQPIRELLDADVEASFQGDPAAKYREEVLLSYPVIDALIAYRFAHVLWKLAVPILPRMLTEYVHSSTNIDIHPGATIGESFVIDHASGVVIGETTVIGNHVKVYQGVTLGALSVPSRNTIGKRHPTIEDNVTIYSGATILGGETVIGKGSIIGGNVWITASVPPNSKIYYKP